MTSAPERILTTHVGSLPRPRSLVGLLLARERGEPVDAGLWATEVDAAVRGVVEQQISSGVDIVSDGEAPKVSFHAYIAQRMSGFGGTSERRLPLDWEVFPSYLEMMNRRSGSQVRNFDAPQAIAEVSYDDLSEIEDQTAAFRRALDDAGDAVTGAFLNSISPGMVATTMHNAWYESHEAYLDAIADELHKEYRSIIDAGFLLQIDAPDLPFERTSAFRDLTDAEYLDIVDLHVAAINRALGDIPPHLVRLHSCWGNYDGPHVHDFPLDKVLPGLYQANVGALSLPLANPRHQHEYAAIADNPLPDHMVLIPGVIDVTTNYVEHEEVVAQRLAQAIRSVGAPERVIAGTDCGFTTLSDVDGVAPELVWVKLRALRAGADLASARL